MKRKKPDLELRELPSSSQFSTPHSQCKVGALYFLELLEEQTELLDRAVAHAGGTDEAMMRLAPRDALQRQAISEAVQVFAGMTVESAVNLLGVLALGEAQFMEQLERRPVIEKLSTLLRLIDGGDPDPSDELLAIATRLAAARNDFVHAKPREGPLRPRSPGRRGDLKSARAAVTDMEAFLDLLRVRDRRYSVFFIRS